MRPVIAGNWKMHGLTPQLEEIKEIAASVTATPPHADVLIGGASLTAADLDAVLGVVRTVAATPDAVAAE